MYKPETTVGSGLKPATRNAYHSKYLQRCPFCGNEHPTMEDVETDRDEKGEIIITFEVSCPKCGAMGPYDRFQSEDQAADSWNNRFTKEEF